MYSKKLNVLQKRNQGLTLTELLIVVSIIAMISTGGFIASVTVSRRAKAAKIVTDFRRMELAWNQWRVDTNQAYLSEEIYHNSIVENQTESGISYCMDEPFISQTDIAKTQADLPEYSGPNPVPGYKGPYLSEILRDPYGHEYSYDYDNDTYDGTFCTILTNNQGYNGGLNTSGGVTLTVQFCSQDASKYSQLGAEIDKIIDNSDGPCSGKVVWRTLTGAKGGIHYRIAN